MLEGWVDEERESHDEHDVHVPEDHDDLDEHDQEHDDRTDVDHSPDDNEPVADSQENDDDGEGGLQASENVRIKTHNLVSIHAMGLVARFYSIR